MEAPELERRLAAIVAADVEGYSRLMHGDEEATMATLSARRGVIDDLIGEYRGRIANTAGDSVLAEFASVLDAVSCALAVQKAVGEANDAEPGAAMRFRIGINVGDVMVKDGDIFGDGVNVAARLESLADGGGICVSRGVRDHLRHRANLVFEDLGEQLVKNIAHPIRAYRLRPGDTGGEVGQEEAALGLETSTAEDVIFADNEAAFELTLWNSVKDGGPDELASYLEHYPAGTFASLARTRQTAAEDETAGTEPLRSSGDSASPDSFDMAFWEAIKATQTPEELAVYLESHPDGHFAGLARARLVHPAEGEAAPPAETTTGGAVELAFWESIENTADPHLFAAYLEKYPEGEFAVIARARLALSAEAAEGPRE